MLKSTLNYNQPINQSTAWNQNKNRKITIKNYQLKKEVILETATNGQTFSTCMYTLVHTASSCNVKAMSDIYKARTAWLC